MTTYDLSSKATTYDSLVRPNPGPAGYKGGENATDAIYAGPTLPATSTRNTERCGNCGYVTEVYGGTKIDMGKGMKPYVTPKYCANCGDKYTPEVQEDKPAPAKVERY